MTEQLPPPNPGDIPTRLVRQPAPEARHQSFGRKVARYVIAPVTVATALTSWAGIVAGDGPNPIPVIEQVADNIRVDFLNQSLCPAAGDDKKAQDIREGIIATVTNPDLEFARKEAEAAQLHFADNTEIIKSVLESPTAEDATAAVDTFVRENYDFSLHLDMPPDLMNQPEALAKYKASLQSFAMYTSMMPSELLQRVEVSELHLGPVVEDSRGHKAGDYSPDTGIVNIDVNYIDSPRAFIHEFLGHAAHNVTCEGYYENDPAISGLNPEGFEYLGYRHGSDNIPNTSPNEFSSDYAKTNVMEDVGEIAERYILGSMSQGLALTIPDNDLAEKTAIVIDRLDDLAPGVGSYFRDTQKYFYDFTLLAEQGGDYSIQTAG